jgi:hypothetical protein
MSTARVYDKQTEFSYCKEIDLWTLDLPRTTCKYKTAYCRKHCYNNKIEAAYSSTIPAKDKRNKKFWENLEVSDFIDFVERKAKSKYPVKRFRFCSRGEIGYTIASLYKVYKIAVALPEIIFWIPTRAWRTKHIGYRFWLNQIRYLPNTRVMASIDPSTSANARAELLVLGWSTMYFGDNDNTIGRTLCPKTWFKASGIKCSTCQDGCFSKDRVDVHLKKH